MGYETYACDVLVVGGGAAAGRAAIAAHRRGAQVRMVMKGRFGHSGSSAYKVAEIAGYNAADGMVDPDDSPAEHLRDILAAAAGTCDERLARIVAEEAPATLPELARLGVPFHMDGERYLEVKGCFASRPRMHLVQGHAEPIVAAQRREILALGTPVHEGTMVTRLVVRDGVCLGAVGVDEEGNGILFRAKAVVLGTGGAGTLFLHSLNPPDVTGDSYALGYAAGAELVNMEFMQAGPGMVYPIRNSIQAWLWGLHPLLANGTGEPFLERYLPAGLTAEQVYDRRVNHYPFSTYDGSQYVDIAIQKELTAGRGTPHNGVHFDLRHAGTMKVPDTAQGRETQRLWAITRRWLIENRRLDLAEQTVEIACFGHAINGGLLIDPQGESSVKGLFAAGEAAGGPHGADRLGGNMIVTCQVFGRRAGEAAAARALEVALAEHLDDAFAAEVARWRAWQTRASGKAPEVAALRLRLQEAAWRYLLVVRQESGLRRCLDEVEEIRAALADARADSPRQLTQILELENLLTVAEIMARAALMRTESRGSHYREDCPARDDTNWQLSIVSRRSEAGHVQEKRRLPRLAS